jgi:hypothetical protein
MGEEALEVVEKVRPGSSGSGDCMVELGGYRRWRNHGMRSPCGASHGYYQQR